MHSIEELNKKVWYRLLKILYGLVCIPIVGITILLVWSSAYSPEYDTVTCKWNNQSLQVKDLTWYGNDALWSGLPEDISAWSPADRESVSVSCFAKAIRVAGKTVPGYQAAGGATEQQFLQGIVNKNYPAGVSAGGAPCEDWLPWDHQVFVSTCPRSESAQTMNASSTVSDVEAIAAGGMPTSWSAQDYHIFLTWAADLDLTDNSNFNVTPAAHTFGGLARLLSYAIPALLIEALLFEIIRRGFYYIATGKIFPRT